MPCRQRRAGEEGTASLRLAAVPGQPLRSAVAQPHPRGPPFPQDELPQVQGRPTAGEARCRASPNRASWTKSKRLYEEAVATKNQIVRANLRLVVSIAKRHVGPAENFFELVSDGNMSLMRAVEKFDYSRGYKFSTYASWAIMKNFARTIPDEHRYRDRFRTSHGEMFTSTRGRPERPVRAGIVAFAATVAGGEDLGRLDEREQKIIISRFGLQRGQEPLRSNRWVPNWGLRRNESASSRPAP